MTWERLRKDHPGRFMPYTYGGGGEATKSKEKKVMGKAEVILTLFQDNEVEAETRWIFIKEPQVGKEIYLEILGYLKKAAQIAVVEPEQKN